MKTLNTRRGIVAASAAAATLSIAVLAYPIGSAFRNSRP